MTKAHVLVYRYLFSIIGAQTFLKHIYVYLSYLIDLLIHFRLMNPRAKKGEAYKPTDVEHMANIITHGVRDKYPVL